MLVPAGPVVFVLGGPGSGKGTQCAKLIERYGAAHFSAGDLLREEVKKGTEQGKMIDEMIKQGAIVPAQVTLDLLKGAIQSTKGPYLIDGFPRNLDNMQAFVDQVQGGCALTLFYDVSEEVMEGRLLKRGETSGRSDDNAATIKKRFKTFTDQSVPVIEVLRGQGVVAQIDASKAPDDVFTATCEVFDKIAKPAMIVPNGPVVFVLGGPGSGKGTQCAKLIERYGAAHYSAGDLLRDEVKKGTEKGKMIDEMIKQGAIVPAQITLDLLKAAIKSRKGPYLIDGFPRSLDNLAAFDDQVKGGCALTLFYDVSEEVMEGRLLKRGETSGRSDDNAATIKKRFKTFTDQSVPVIEVLRGRGVVAQVDASKSPDDVFAATCEAFDKIAKPKKMLVPDGPVVFVLGGPGSGKGTQCAKLIERYGAAHFSAGDLLREEVKKGTEQGKMIDEMIKQGAIVPAQVTLDLLKGAIQSTKGPYLIDGFPRSLDNMQAFVDQVKGGCALTLFYDVSEEVMEGRLLKRGETSGRSDDNAATIKKRFKTFTDQSVPVIEILRGQGLVATIDASRSPHEVYLDTCKAFDKIADPVNVLRPDGPVVFVLGGPGSGKGTQCEKLIQRYGAAHFSAGDLLRDEVKKGTEQGKMIDEMIRQGAIVPAQITLDLLKAAIKSRKGPYLIDGFPRSLDNLAAFDDQVKGGCALTLFYDVSEQVMEGRLLKRGETSGRSDDNAATIKKRFNTFRDQSVPVIEVLRNRGLVATIDASKAPDGVFTATCKAFDKIANPLVTWRKTQVAEYLQKHDVKARLEYALQAAIGAQAPDPTHFVGESITPPGPRRPRSACGTFLRIITVNDVYKLDNYPRVATAVNAAKKAQAALDCVVISTLNGDFMSPCPITALDGGRAMTEGLNMGKIDFVTLGNHELDYGFECPVQRMKTFKGKCINSNVTTSPLDTLPKYHVINVGDRKVLLTGLLSDDTSIYAPANKPTVTNPAVAAVEVWEAAKVHLGYTPDVHLPMTHQLVPEDKAFCTALAKHKELGARTPIILGGHEHEIYIDSVGKMKIVKTGADAEQIGFVDIWWATDGVMHSQVTLVPGVEFDEEPTAKAFHLQTEEFLKRVMASPLFQIPHAMSSKTVRHSTSGVATMLLTYVKRGMASEGVEVAMCQGGFVRAGKDYEAGTFTMGDLFAEFAFEGPFAIIPLKGSIIQESTSNTRNMAKPAPNFLHYDEGVVIDDSESHTIVSVNGVPFDPEKIYTVAIYQVLLTGLNVIEPLMTYVTANVKVPDAESCRLCKNIVIETAMKDEWRRLLDFQSFDLDGDGKVEVSELRVGVDKLFASATKHGMLSMEEITALIKSRQGHLSLVEQLVKTLDANGDGFISIDEMMALAID